MQRRPGFGGEEPRPPVFVGEVDRFLQEGRLLKGKVDLEQGRSRERSFREQKVAAASSTANAKVVRSYVEIRQSTGDRLRRDRFFISRKARPLAARRVDHVPTEQDDLSGRLRS